MGWVSWVNYRPVLESVSGSNDWTHPVFSCTYFYGEQDPVCAGALCISVCSPGALLTSQLTLASTSAYTRETGHNWKQNFHLEAPGISYYEGGGSDTVKSTVQRLCVFLILTLVQMWLLRGGRKAPSPSMFSLGGEGDIFHSLVYFSCETVDSDTLFLGNKRQNRTWF